MCTICFSLTSVLQAEAAGETLYDPTGQGGYAAVREAVSTPDLTEGADAAAGTGTAYSVNLGDVFQGEIGSGGDVDWIAVDLTAGETHTFMAWGVNGTLEGVNDTMLTIYNPGGQQVDFNDDVAPQFANYFSVLQYTAETSGTHYMAVSRAPGAVDVLLGGETQPDIGDYRVLAASEFFTIEQAATYMVEVDWGVPTPFFFDSETVSVNLTGLTADGRQLARWALEAWSDAIGLTFEEVATGGQIRFDDNQPGAMAGPGNLNPVTGVNQFSTVNVSTQWLENEGTTIDSYSYSTYLHEIGHALGLGHPGPYDGSAVFGDAIQANDSTLYSVMSYFPPEENPNVGGGNPGILTPMRADLVALHSIYGAPAANAGNTTWGVNSNVGGWLGDLFGILYDGETADEAFYAGGPVAYTIYDTGGIDTVDFSTVAANQRIDLREGSISNVGGVEGGMSIDVTTVVENAVGGSGNDRITGNGAANTLTGGAGDDTINGLGGDDTAVLAVNRDSVTVTADGNALIIQSALGTDRYLNVESFRFNDATLTAAELISGMPPPDNGPTPGDDTLTGTDGDDSIAALGGNDFVSGGIGNDTLSGGAGNDTLRGESGNDLLEGAEGNDIKIGGDGTDTAVYAISLAEVTAVQNGNDVTINAGAFGIDVLTGVELFQFTDGTVDLAGLLNGGTGGGAAEDLIIVGDDGDNVFIGGSGNDSLYGQGGNDNLLGGAGNDLLAGSDGNDTITGGDGNDLVGGGFGDDLITGGAGNDTIGAGQGNDTADGGAGDDIVNGGAGDDSLSGGIGNDTMGAGFNHDTVFGGDGDDSLGGGTGRDVIFAGAGNDAVGGGEGDDSIEGGAGNDFLAGGGRDDTIDGGDGDDRINGGAGNDELTGGAGADLFIFNDLVSGEIDIIHDFEDGLDRIRLIGVEGQGMAGKFANLEIANGDFGAEVVYNGHLIYVDGLNASDLDQGDFVFL